MDKIKTLLSTALISDVLDEEGYPKQMLPIEIKPNYLSAKMFGRARIMTLKPINSKENYKEVYKGLYFLEMLSKGEVFVVANAFEHYAFFGELMSTLAKVRNVAGTLIDGCTRDKIQTIEMKYPVFARKNTARDIKKRGVVDKIDVKSARIGDVLISKGDYLFGDCDGVIVIPCSIVKKIISKSMQIAYTEQKVKKSIKKGLSVDELLKNFGEF